MARGRIPALGNIYEMSIDQIVSGAKSSELRMNMASNHTMEVCRYCDDFLQENMVLQNLIRRKK